MLDIINWSCQLVKKCMVQVGQQGIVREIKTCRMHDFMRDLCLLKAQEENFLQVVNFSNRNEARIGEVRRISIHLEAYYDRIFPPRGERHSHLRSLLYSSFPAKQFLESSILIHSMFQEDFKWLRVLKLEPLAQLVVLPTEIGNMVRLRYFSLSCCQINHLLSTMGNLVRMQTLEFHDSVLLESKTIANVISKMEELRHLYMPYLDRWGRRIQLSTLCKLQTLCHASSLSWDLSDLVKLASLRKLSIELFEKLKNLKEILRRSSSTLDGIRSLSVCNNDEIECAEGAREVREVVLSCRYVYKLEASGPMEELPAELQYYSNRTKLSLSYCHELKEDQLAILEKLPNLNSLSLNTNVFHGSVITLVSSRGGFPRLENLFLHQLFCIQDWRVEEGAMPSLCRLHITSCVRLKEVPEGLRYIDTLSRNYRLTTRVLYF